MVVIRFASSRRVDTCEIEKGQARSHPTRNHCHDRHDRHDHLHHLVVVVVVFLFILYLISILALVRT